MHLLGQTNIWTDGLSMRWLGSLNLKLHFKVFALLCCQWGTPHAFSESIQWPLYITRYEATAAGGPCAFLVDWNVWENIYLFPSSVNSVLFKVCLKLRSFKDRVLLIVPEIDNLVLVSRATAPLSTTNSPGTIRPLGLLLKSFALHVWNFWGSFYTIGLFPDLHRTS